MVQLGVPRGVLTATLGVSWGSLGTPWGAFGSPLEPFWVLSGTSGRLAWALPVSPGRPRSMDMNSRGWCVACVVSSGAFTCRLLFALFLYFFVLDHGLMCQVGTPSAEIP